MKPAMLVASITLALAAAAQAQSTMTPVQLNKELKQPKTAPYVLDVRTAEEFAEGHVPHAVNVPVQDLETRIAEVPHDREVVVYCEVGGRAARASALLRERGYARTIELEGSMSAWRKAGLPVEKSPVTGDRPGRG